MLSPSHLCYIDFWVLKFMDLQWTLEIIQELEREMQALRAQIYQVIEVMGHQLHDERNLIFELHGTN